MITPTIGRVVLLHEPNSPHGKAREIPVPALVCFVHSDRCINVGGFNDQGYPIRAVSVPLLQDDDKVPATGIYACWMPYQKAVASGQIPPVLHEVLEVTGGTK